jgi:hypothetical protein
MAKKTKKSLDGRHRDTTGRIDKKHGNTRVKALRKTYGEHFAKGRRADMMLKTLLAETGTESLHAYLRKHHKWSDAGPISGPLRVMSKSCRTGSDFSERQAPFWKANLFLIGKPLFDKQALVESASMIVQLFQDYPSRIFRIVLSVPLGNTKDVGWGISFAASHVNWAGDTASLDFSPLNSRDRLISQLRALTRR